MQSQIENSKIRKIISCLLCTLFFGCTEKTAEKPDTRALVRVGTATNGVEFVEALNVQGMIRAKNTATIAARVPGTIDEILVEEGARVKRGAPLFKIDQVNLANAVRAAKDDLTMAKAKLAQAEATAAKATRDVERMARLLKDGAVTRDMFEKADVAAKSHAAARDAAKATLTKAETGCAVAEKNFADSEIKAPFEGIVTMKHKSTGDFCGPGAKIFDLEDSSCYEVCVSLNASQYGRVTVGQTEIEMPSPSEPKDDKRCVVSYKSPSVNPLTRTFEVRAAMTKSDKIATGMLVDCRVVFARRICQAVPAAAVAFRGGGDCIFTVVSGRVVRVPIVAGLVSNGFREIISPKLMPDDELIVEGMLLVNEGDEVRVKGK